MAKSKGKKGKLPKRFAGVKIPKAARKGPVADFITSSGGQVILAEALLAAASVLAVKTVDPDSRAGQALRHPIESLKAAGRSGKSALDSAEDRASSASARLSNAFNEAIRAFRNALANDYPRSEGESEDDLSTRPDMDFDTEATPEKKRTADSPSSTFADTH
jgi:hypothetical protein